MTNPRIVSFLLVSVAMLLVAAACETDAANDTAEAEAGSIVVDVNFDFNDDEIEAQGESISVDQVSFDPPVIDTEAMTSDLPDDVQIEEYGDTYVGRVTDALFIALSFDEQYAGGPQDVVVYLCDDAGIVAYLTGSVTPGTNTIAGQVIEVEFDESNGEIAGTVNLDGDESHDFTAKPADGPAGMYVATHGDNDVDVVTMWIVLEDGEQRGVHNLPCIPVPRFGCIPLPNYSK